MVSKRFFTTEKKKELIEISAIETNKMLGLSFQGQGMLDLAFEKFRLCPVDATMRDLLEDAARRSIRYLEGLGDRGVAPSPEAIAALAGLDIPLPEQPQDPAATLAELDALVSPATTAMAGRRFFGFVIGGALPVSVASNWLATAWDQNSALHAPTPGTATLEKVTMRKKAENTGITRAMPP